MVPQLDDGAPGVGEGLQEGEEALGGCSGGHRARRLVAGAFSMASCQMGVPSRIRPCPGAILGMVTLTP